MLTGLSIKNYALIDELQVSFNNGLSIITGETGAGKSILLGGLSLVLGKRADLSQINDKSKKCVIEAVFDIANYDLKLIFEEKDFDYEPQTIIRREILPSGKSRAFVNDTPVTLENLVFVSGYLLDIHSQHQTRQLIGDSYQFMVIDALANNKTLLKEYSTLLLNYKSIERRVKDLEQSMIDAKKEYDYNQFLFNELNDAQLKSDELEDLETQFEQLNNVEIISETLSLTKSLLNNEDIGIVDKLNEVKRALNRINDFNKDYKSVEERINSVAIELDDILIELDVFEENLSSDPEELEKVNQKLQTINNLLHKHSVLEVSDLILIRDDLNQKISITENLDDTITEATAELGIIKTQLKNISSKISVNRQEVIPKFTKNLETILSELGMPNAKFNIVIEKTENFKANGMDDLQFLFMANKGSQFTELKKAASGGELSRIMLAIKSILANYIKLPTLMFDEIDTGVSGEISNKMGEIMKLMSKNMQVFTITHLPQIASKGDWHFKVYKTDVDEVTHTQMKALNYDERVVEIAQMLGGLNVSDSALAHAKQLLN
ncbi:DNA repair protein RecN [Winogradskyella immobilis]|uniref:DNA repair protein RecN n=1 Tax=Winogradskyella immobilis TaxID=2816852 RepID=A0ABS8ENL7_9FLAO|nr:DNA repair protein RecN [Winogradskyella immobilis]MCC1484803.1 DNA repair protein RecN [Winogradskyella immobilis]MCG0016895.1 DNA repair protein RecN [Winogradskyella immobilis]